jgi:hypothetical protein
MGNMQRSKKENPGRDTLASGPDQGSNNIKRRAEKGGETTRRYAIFVRLWKHNRINHVDDAI